MPFCSLPILLSTFFHYFSPLLDCIGHRKRERLKIVEISSFRQFSNDFENAAKDRAVARIFLIRKEDPYKSDKNSNHRKIPLNPK